MQSWSTAREVEKPKTLTARRLEAQAGAEVVYVKLIQQAEAARMFVGRDAPVTATLFDGARAIRELIDAMQPGARS